MRLRAVASSRARSRAGSGGGSGPPGSHPEKRLPRPPGHASRADLAPGTPGISEQDHGVLRHDSLDLAVGAWSGANVHEGAGHGLDPAPLGGRGRNLRCRGRCGGRRSGRLRLCAGRSTDRSGRRGTGLRGSRCTGLRRGRCRGLRGGLGGGCLDRGLARIGLVGTRGRGERRRRGGRGHALRRNDLRNRRREGDHVGSTGVGKRPSSRQEKHEAGGDAGAGPGGKTATQLLVAPAAALGVPGHKGIAPRTGPQPRGRRAGPPGLERGLTGRATGGDGQRLGAAFVASQVGHGRGALMAAGTESVPPEPDPGRQRRLPASAGMQAPGVKSSGETYGAPGKGLRQGSRGAGCASELRALPRPEERPAAFSSSTATYRKKPTPRTGIQLERWRPCVEKRSWKGAR